MLPVTGAASAGLAVLSPPRVDLSVGSGRTGAGAPGSSAPGGGLLVWALLGLLAGFATSPRGRRFLLMLSA
jgi:hypothetical protein